MTRCDNCFGIAAYTCADPGVNPVNYCSTCLPVWLQDRANAGQFPLVQSVEEKPAEIEETPVEETSETTSSKSKKKKAADLDENN